MPDAAPVTNATWFSKEIFMMSFPWWRFRWPTAKRNLQVRVQGSWTFNSIYPVIEAALTGFGLAYMPEELALPHIRSGRLQTVLKDWYPTFPGLHLFFASQRRSSPALSLVVEALRYRRN
jgi:DNA-binding transcriptional LysR family regulator